MTDENYGEVVTVYTERSAVPNSLWLSLLQDAQNSIDILVYAGLHLPEAHPSWAKEIQKKCEDGVRVRIAFGDPECMQVARGVRKKASAKDSQPGFVMLSLGPADFRFAKSKYCFPLNSALQLDLAVR